MFTSVNTNQLIHSGSPFYLGLALHSWAKSYKPPVTIRDAFGVVVSQLRTGGHSFVVRTSLGYAAGESLLCDVFAIRATGGSDIVLTVLLNDTTIPAAGEFDFSANFNNKDPPLPGDAIVLNTSYSAGGGPNSPTTNFSIQFA